VLKQPPKDRLSLLFRALVIQMKLSYVGRMRENRSMPFLFGIFLFCSSCATVQVTNGYSPNTRSSTQCAELKSPSTCQPIVIEDNSVIFYIGCIKGRMHPGLFGPPLLPILPAFWAWETREVSDFSFKFSILNPNKKRVTIDFKNWEMVTEDQRILKVKSIEFQKAITQKQSELIFSSDAMDGEVVFSEDDDKKQFTPGNFTLRYAWNINSQDTSSIASWSPEKKVLYIPVTIGDAAPGCDGYPR
jgi:hypothetical protein